MSVPSAKLTRVRPTADPEPDEDPPGMNLQVSNRVYRSSPDVYVESANKAAASRLMQHMPAIVPAEGPWQATAAN